MNVTSNVTLNDDGSISFLLPDGNPLESKFHNQVFEQHGDTIRQLLEQHVSKFNEDNRLLREIHLDTPEPTYRSRFCSRDFNELEPIRPIETGYTLPPPVKPSDWTPTFIAKLIPALANRSQISHARQVTEYEDNLARWKAAKTSHAEAQARELARYVDAAQRYDNRKAEFEKEQHATKVTHQYRLSHDSTYMFEFLEQELNSLKWPRQTNVSIEVSSDGIIVFLDVDLPEIEEFPKREASLSTNGRKILFRNVSDKTLRESYSLHVHGVAFRLLGSTFSILPGISEVVISGYSQRLDVRDGNTKDDYLYSVRVSRKHFGYINFDRLASVNPIEALATFELRRDMTKTGFFKPIQPFEPSQLF